MSLPYHITPALLFGGLVLGFLFLTVPVTTIPAVKTFPVRLPEGCLADACITVTRAYMPHSVPFNAWGGGVVDGTYPSLHPQLRMSQASPRACQQFHAEQLTHTIIPVGLPSRSLSGTSLPSGTRGSPSACLRG